MTDEMTYLEEKERFFKTITVKELIEELSRFPLDKKVFVTWESTVNELRKEFIYEAYTGSIYIDGEYGFYKKSFEKNRRST